MTGHGASDAVLQGYESVYEALPRATTFNRLWREHAYRGEFPEELAHIGFLTETEGRRLLELLDVPAGGVLVDVACGTGGPGLWAARRAGASLIGIDPTVAGIAAARARAQMVGAEHARFQAGTFERTGLGDASADAVMTIEAFQYAPDKARSYAELWRVLKPGGRLGIVCFEVDADKVAGVPVLGVDPVADHRPGLEAAGFAIDAYEETPAWADRVYPAFQALIDHADELRAEMGTPAAGSVLAEAMLTVTAKPYPRRVLIVARRPAQGDASV